MASITKRGKTWQARISYKNRDGKFTTSSKGGFKTKKAAILYASDLETSIADGNLPSDPKVSYVFADYFNSWYEDFKKPKVSERTQHRYVITHKEIKSYFKQTNIDHITRRDYQKFINDYGGAHAKDTVKKVNGLIRACVRNAVFEDVIDKNFTEGVELVFDPNRTKKIDYLNVDEMQKLADYSFDHVNANFTSHQMIITAIFTGMRLGEIQGLRWQDVNVEFKSLTIAHALNENTQELIPTKNKSSNRIIRINKKLADMFQEMAKHRRGDLVFTNQYGRVPTSAAVNKTLRASLKALKINRKGFHFHSLRHTHVAYLLYSGIDLYAISKRLGHSDLGTTTRIYSYLIEEYKAQTDNQIESVLNGIEQKQSSKTVANS